MKRIFLLKCQIPNGQWEYMMIQGLVQYNLWKLGKRKPVNPWLGLGDFLWLFRPTRRQKIHGVHWLGCSRAPMDVLNADVAGPLDAKNCMDLNGDLGSWEVYICNKCTSVTSASLLFMHHHSQKICNAGRFPVWNTIDLQGSHLKRKQVFQNLTFSVAILVSFQSVRWIFFFRFALASHHCYPTVPPDIEVGRVLFKVASRHDASRKSPEASSYENVSIVKLEW